MHHGQSRGGNTRKVCKTQVNLSKTGGRICESRGGKKNVRETGGKCTETAKIGDETLKKFFGKVQKLFRKSKNFSEIVGESETEGKCIMVSGGMDAPVDTN